MKELIEIQSKLKAEKSQHNRFGNYDYRSLEDVVEALKPLMKETKTFLTMTDEIKAVGDRFYIVSTATIHNEGGDKVSVDGWAREAQMQKGMSDAQVTGSTSTYARKYALNGLFAIDDTKDDDSKDKPEVIAPPKLVNNNQVKELENAITQHGVDKAKFMLHFGVNKLGDLYESNFTSAMEMINKKTKS